MNIRKTLTGLDSLLNRFGLGYSVPKSSLSINDMRAELNEGGVQQSSRYSVEISPPPVLFGTIEDRRLSMRCFSATLPGKNLMLQDNIRYGHGVVDRLPHNTMYTPVNMSFILDEDGAVNHLFQTWLSYIHNADSSTQKGDEYLVEYKSNYSTDISLNIFNTRHQMTQRVSLFQAFPYAIGDIQLAWDGQNQLSVLPITFAYVDYKYFRAAPSKGGTEGFTGISDALSAVRNIF